MILDNKGHLVWFRPVAKGVDTLNLQAQTYNGKPVLTWWQGFVAPGTGEMTGTWYVAPPTRLERTSSVGVSARIDISSDSIGSCWPRSARIASAS